MMKRALEDVGSVWRALRAAWGAAQRGWQDRTTLDFERRFFTPFESQMTRYMRGSDEVLQTLRTSERAAEATMAQLRGDSDRHS